MDDLVGVHQLLELVLCDPFGLGFEPVLVEHQQDDAPKDRNPDDPGARRNSKWLGCFLGLRRFVVLLGGRHVSLGGASLRVVNGRSKGKAGASLASAAKLGKVAA